MLNIIHNAWRDFELNIIHTFTDQPILLQKILTTPQYLRAAFFASLCLLTLWLFVFSLIFIDYLVRHSTAAIGFDLDLYHVLAMVAFFSIDKTWALEKTAICFVGYLALDSWLRIGFTKTAEILAAVVVWHEVSEAAWELVKLSFVVSWWILQEVLSPVAWGVMWMGGWDMSKGTDENTVP